MTYQTKHLRKGFYLRCASQRVSQCDSIVVDDIELSRYRYVIDHLVLSFNV